MKNLTRLIAASGLLGVFMLGGCAAGHVKPAERDTTGTYDGIWIGEVDGPRASRESLPGNWYMTCDWEPYTVYLTVDDGRIQLGRLEQKTLVSTTGKFRIDVSNGMAGMTGGTMAGNGQYIQKFTGTLAGEELRGRYTQYITSRGGTGCNAPIRFRRYTEDAA